MSEINTNNELLHHALKSGAFSDRYESFWSFSRRNFDGDDILVEIHSLSRGLQPYEQGAAVYECFWHPSLVHPDPEMVRREYINNSVWWDYPNRKHETFPRLLPDNLRQLYVAGEQSNMITIANIANESISSEVLQPVLDTYRWFDEQTAGWVPRQVTNIMIADNLSDGPEAGPDGTLVGGYYIGDRKLVYLHRELFDDPYAGDISSWESDNSGKWIGMLNRYRTEGESLAALTMTHELAHALQRSLPFLREEYAQAMADLEELYPEISLPTSYAGASPFEDFAESMVLYRFRPDRLDSERRELVEYQLQVAERAGRMLLGGKSGLWQGAAKMPHGYFPSFRLPESIHYVSFTRHDVAGGGPEQQAGRIVLQGIDDEQG